MRSSCEIFCLFCILASKIFFLVFSVLCLSRPIRRMVLSFTKSAPSGAPHAGHQFSEFVVMSLKTYSNSFISTSSIFNDNNNNNNNIEFDIKRSSGIYTASKQRKTRTKTR